MNIEERIKEIDVSLQALVAWSYARVEIQHRIEILTERLIASNDEGARGAIKELRQLYDLPDTLQSERAYLAAELTEQSASAQ